MTTAKIDARIAKLEGLIDKLTDLTPDTPTATPAALDPSGNPGTVAAGELIESSWGNSVAQRVVRRFPTASALSAYAGSAGELAVTTDQLIVYMRMGGVWRPTGLGGRYAFRLVGAGAGQSIPKSVSTVCTWGSEQSDPYNLVTAGVFTVPAGWAGRWQFDWGVEFGIGSDSSLRLVYCEATGLGRLGETTESATTASTTRIAGSASRVLAVGNTVGIVMYHTDTVATLACNTNDNQYFSGHYVGPF